MDDAPAVGELGAAALAAAIRERELSAVEAVEAALARIDARNPALNAVVVRRDEAALAEAREADARLAAGGPPGPLHGVPITVKEAIAVAGLPWTNGSRLTAGRRAERDALAVHRLRAAGAVVIGKTNVPEFCMWYDTDNLVYGRTRNPHAAERSPGGSSGGESAAVAAGISPLGVGSDLGSSIRQPAAWTGVFGLKPSRDAVPFDGHAGFGVPIGWKAFGGVGPLARSVADLELALDVMAGRPLAGPDPRPPLVAVFEDDGLQPVAAACRAAVRRAAAALADAGLALEDGVPPNLAELRAAFDLVVTTELRLFAYPAVAGREGELSEYGRRALAGLDELAPDGEAYADAWRRLAELEFAADAWQDRHPLALCPVTPVTAPRAAEGLVAVDGEPFRPGGKLTLCTWANALGLPAVSVPFGRDDDGLPLAVQVVGRRGGDRDVLAAARLLEEAA